MQSFDRIENSIESYLHTQTTSSHKIYIIVVIAIIAIFIALPFIYVDVSVQGSGVVRPIGEKTEIKASVSELIDSVYVHEGQSIEKGDILLSIRSSNVVSQINFQGIQANEYYNHISDLSILVRKQVPARFKSPMIQQEYIHYKQKESEAKITLDKAKKDLNRHQTLHHKGVISNEEYEDYVHQKNRAESELASLQENQFSVWETNLNNYQIQLREANKYIKQEENNLDMYYIKSPVDGTLDFFSGVYAGGSIRTGETLAIISPDSTLFVETHVQPKDIGYIHIGMPTTIQVAAFNYNEWGILKGSVSEISSDYFVDQVSGASFYKVKVKLDKNYLTLRNGRKGYIKKGMTVQTNFIITSRSLFQLLYMKVDEIFNPRQVQEQATEKNS